MKKIYLIDGNSLIYRMFFALPEFSTSKWKWVNALFWVAKFFTGQLIKESPDYLIFVRDAKGKNFRHDLYADYKATRDRMPDNLRAQLDDINAMIQTMDLKIIEESWYEADDVIASLAKKYKKDYEIYILSWDKDLYRLVEDQVKIYDTLKKKIFWRKETREKFEIDAEFVSDYLAIVGDSSDNIPWISWIGPKKAVVLINTFGSLEDIYKAIEKQEWWEALDISDEAKKVLSGKTLEKIVNGKEIAFLSKKLATLDESVDLSHFSLDDFIFHEEKIFSSKVKDFFREFEFFSLIGEEKKENEKTWKDLKKKVQIIAEDTDLKALEKKIEKYEKIVLDTETTSLQAEKAELVGVSLYLDEENLFYINAFHKWQKVSYKALKEFLEKLLASDKMIIGHNLKYDLEIIQYFFKKEWNNNHHDTDKTPLQSSLFD